MVPEVLISAAVDGVVAAARRYSSVRGETG
eukprot:COSAG01_NODE_59486_length_300_cov_0.616915_1_plen_29_part_01